ncbi:MAG: aminoglycoside phosphotransferase family protein [Muribaculum sp.]|nr:aminoglycoside phosphotransferase family protein [Muribaculaceae bacterium]MCM1081438.1 aminoglycoside phosphotransferase family protein [Muribaculum sp.]
MNDVTGILKEFAVEGDSFLVKPLGNGLINDTFVVQEAETKKPRYVLQRINDSIFRDVDLLQHNIVAVTSHIRRKLQQIGETDIRRKVLTPVKLKNSEKTYFRDPSNGYFWRVMEYIDDSVTVEEVTPRSSYDAGFAFGRFQSMLVDLPEELGETIPDFHNMELRLRQLDEAVEADAAGRVGEVKEELDAIAARAEAMTLAQRLFREGTLPKRVCHCDTKVNNMLFDREGNALCVIDLDTVMPSFVFSDYGDFLRTAANTGAEDDRDLNRVGFDMEIFKSFTRGYLNSAKDFLLPVEIENLPYAAALFPYMQAVRFLTDYINGDVYYKTTGADHNLVRTRAQLHLLYDVERQMLDMQRFIAELL